MKNILKCNFAICMLFIFIFSGCGDLKNLYYWGYTTSYRLPIYTDTCLSEAMDEMFNKYPEMHITNEIVKIKKIKGYLIILFLKKVLWYNG